MTIALPARKVDESRPREAAWPLGWQTASLEEVLFRKTIENRTYGTHKYPYIYIYIPFFVLWSPVVVIAGRLHHVFFVIRPGRYFVR